MRRLVPAFVLLNAGLIALVWDAGAQQLPLASKGPLIGTWTLVRWWNIADDGHEMPPPIDGKDTKGLLMFDSSGRYSLVIASDRPKWKSPDRMEGTPDENTAAARGTLAYFGTYSVSEPDQTFVLHVDRSLHPNINGTDQKRFFSIAGDEMKVSTPPFRYPKGTFTGYYIWTRTKG
jgi:hypothetical protein